MAEVKWDGPNTLQIDSWVTHRPQALGRLRDDTITIEVTDGCSWWRTEIPAPWRSTPTVGVEGTPE